MIVRIATEDQYRLADGGRERLNELDNAVVEAVEAGDEESFKQLFEEMLSLVRTGDHVPDDSLESSDLILPPPDLSLEEARREFTGDGLLPE